MRCKALIIIWLLAAGRPTLADEVYFNNEDRFTGSLVRMTEGKLVFKTDHADAVSITMDGIARIVTVAPVHVSLTDGGVTTGTAFINTSGGISPSVGAKGIDLSTVSTISPGPTPAVVYSASANVGIPSEN